jgi:hypothetical protein
MKLDGYVGKSVSILLIEQRLFQSVKLVGVESAGIWIDSQPLTLEILRNAGASWPKTSAFFLPFGQVKVIFPAPDL